MTTATIYKYKSAYIIHSDSQTTDGVWIATAPYSLVADESPAHERAAALVNALRYSRTQVEHPKDSKEWNALIAPILELSGTSSWNAFAQSARCVGIEQEHGQLTLTPHHFHASDQGFEAISGESVVVHYPCELTVIETALEVAFSNCR